MLLEHKNKRMSDEACLHEKLEEWKGSLFCITCGLEKEDHVPLQQNRAPTNRRSRRRKTDEEVEFKPTEDDEWTLGHHI